MLLWEMFQWLTVVVLHVGPQLLLLLAVSEAAVSCVVALPAPYDLGTDLEDESVPLSATGTSYLRTPTTSGPPPPQDPPWLTGEWFH